MPSLGCYVTMAVFKHQLRTHCDISHSCEVVQFQENQNHACLNTLFSVSYAGWRRVLIQQSPASSLKCEINEYYIILCTRPSIRPPKSTSLLPKKSNRYEFEICVNQSCSELTRNQKNPIMDLVAPTKNEADVHLQSDSSQAFYFLIGLYLNVDFSICSPPPPPVASPPPPYKYKSPPPPVKSPPPPYEYKSPPPPSPPSPYYYQSPPPPVKSPPPPYYYHSPPPPVKSPPPPYYYHSPPPVKSPPPPYYYHSPPPPKIYGRRLKFHLEWRHYAGGDGGRGSESMSASRHSLELQGRLIVFGLGLRG
ncbi:hypothetical protein YC2023_055716 [Brassica napus]